MHTPFTFEPTGSEKADAFLAARAGVLTKLEPARQAEVVASTLELVETLPVTSDVSAIVKASVICTVQRWLDEVCEMTA